jgi:phosphoribosylformimino-5-aminoimidazole carboxamide ribotide isomerase
MWFSQRIPVIPAVDVLGAEAVRLHRGDYDSVVERADDPIELAERWVAAGAVRVHLVDLDGARSGRVRPELVRAVVERCSPTPVQASGGIRSLDDARALLDAGADRVVVGTAAWPDPTPWLAFGDALVLALDVQEGQLRAAGWTAAAGLSFLEALDRAHGARVLVTAIDRDGTLAGPDVELVRTAAAAGLRVLAAGGVRSPADVEALAGAGAEAAIVGRALLAYSPATSLRRNTR